MPGPHPAVAATRVAVRGVCTESAGSHLLVACSGGADSLALAAAVAFEAPAAGARAGAVVVDHALQDGSGAVAERAAATATRLGLDPVIVVAAEVAEQAGGGPEARARTARYAALESARARTGAELLLLAHTLDDQAEQVLLGLSRGSGARSLAGMPARRGRLARPFLGVDRATTEAACAQQGLRPWRDPHNDDPRYARVRARRLMSTLEAQLGPGVRQALARSAQLLRADADALDEAAQAALAQRPPGDWPVSWLTDLPAAVRTRVWRLLAVRAGSPPGSVAATHVAALEALLHDWHGQGAVHLPGGVRVARRHGRMHLDPAARSGVRDQ